MLRISGIRLCKKSSITTVFHRRGTRLGGLENLYAYIKPYGSLILREPIDVGNSREGWCYYSEPDVARPSKDHFRGIIDLFRSMEGVYTLRVKLVDAPILYES